MTSAALDVKSPEKLISFNVSITMHDHRMMTYTFDRQPSRKAAFMLSLRKSGSSLFSNLVNAISKHNGLRAIDIPGAMFDHGYNYKDWNTHPKLKDLLWKGNTYVGFRDAPTSFYGDPIFDQGQKLLLVRDPRDVLVSEYFSNAYSHSLPKVEGGHSILAQERSRALQSSIEDYVLARVHALNQTISGYQRILSTPNLKIIRYEDVIFDKASWCGIIASHFDMAITPRLVDDILGWADVRPESEDPTAFVRNVNPGDHKRKLSSATISLLDANLDPIWRTIGYEIG